MGRNVEIKARLREPAAQRHAAEVLADGPAVLLEQDDTFFEAPQGRLKLRQLGPNEGELIHYERPDRSGPKTSHYAIVRTSEPVRLRPPWSYGPCMARGPGARAAAARQPGGG